MKKLLAILLLAATPLFANPFLVCPTVTSGLSTTPTTYTVSGLPNSPITANAVTITSGTVQLDLDLGAAGQNVPYGTYTVSATASNPSGTSASSSNLTLNVPAVTVSAATSVTSSAATLNGNLTQDGGTAATTEGFQYGTTTSYGSDVHSTGSWTSGAFSQNLTGLTSNVTYHYQSYAKNGNCSAYSTDQTFTTSANQALAFSGTGQHLDVSNAIVSSFPMSFACWFKPSSTSVSQTLMAISDTSTSFHYMYLRDTNANTLEARLNNGSSSSTVDSVATLSSGTWYHCVGVYTGTSLTIYLNGTSAVNTATVSIATGLNISSIACDYTSSGSTAQDLANGSIAYPTIWNVALTSTDVANLYNSGAGVDPTTIESGHVVSYSPFQGSTPWADGVSTNTWTTTGSPTTGTAPF